jgi:hypothetical protein
LPGGGNGGVYQPYAKSLYVRASNKVNKSLVHEMQHYADDEEGLIRLSPRHVMGKLGLLALLSTGSISIVMDALQVAQGNFNYLVGTHPLQAVATGAGCGWLWGYYFNPDERRARKSAKESEAHILTLNKELPQMFDDN